MATIVLTPLQCLGLAELAETRARQIRRLQQRTGGGTSTVAIDSYLDAAAKLRDAYSDTLRSDLEYAWRLAMETQAQDLSDELMDMLRQDLDH